LHSFIQTWNKTIITIRIILYVKPIFNTGNRVNKFCFKAVCDVTCKCSVYKWIFDTASFALSWDLNIAFIYTNMEQNNHNYKNYFVFLTHGYVWQVTEENHKYCCPLIAFIGKCTLYLWWTHNLWSIYWHITAV